MFLALVLVALAKDSTPAPTTAPPHPTKDGVVKVTFTMESFRKQDEVDARATEKLLAEALLEGYRAIDPMVVAIPSCGLAYCVVHAQTRGLVVDPDEPAAK